MHLVFSGHGSFPSEKKRTAEKRRSFDLILGAPEGRGDGDVTAGTTQARQGIAG
jgi:hypothetical protein